jgi:hypothetical protein
MNKASMSIARPWWHPVEILPGLMTLFIALGCCQAHAQVGIAGAKAPAASRVAASADHFGVAKSSSSLAVTIRIASLPQQITLCRKPGQARNDLTDGREYQWYVFINADGNDATGTSAYVGGQGWEAKLSIYGSDPDDDLYLNHGCVPHAVDTTRALKARLLSVAGNGIDGSANTLTTLPVVLDFANNTLSVVLDRSLPALAGLSSAAKFDFVSLDIYYDNVIDQCPSFGRAPFCGLASPTRATTFSHFASRLPRTPTRGGARYGTSSASAWPSRLTPRRASGRPPAI